MRAIKGTKIKKLYRYNSDYKMESVDIQSAVSILTKEKEHPWGTLWRAVYRVDVDFLTHEFYGYTLRKAAKEEAILSLREDIARLSGILAKFRKKGNHATT